MAKSSSYMARNRAGGSAGNDLNTIYNNADEGQRRMLDRIKNKLPIGGKAISDFGGDGTITDISYKRLSNGNIQVTTVAEVIIPARKNITIGVGDTKEKIREYTTVTELLKGGDSKTPFKSLRDRKSIKSREK